MVGAKARSAWEQRAGKAGAQVKDEARRVIASLNDEVVPELRRDGSRALRSAAGELMRLAKQLERRGGFYPATGDPADKGR